MTVATESPIYSPLTLGPITIRNRLIVGTGKYPDDDTMQHALAASGAEVITVAVRRERLINADGRSLLDALDLDRYTILPNTAGCFTAPDAVRIARLGRELLEQLDNPGRYWVKLEVLGDKKTLLPDPVGTLDACRELVADGFAVLAYTSDDPIMALRLRDAGASCVMPAGSPIGSGRGIANPANIAIILELLKEQPISPRLRRGVPSNVESATRPTTNDQSPLTNDQQPTPSFPIIVDAGVGTPSDVAIAMELGADGVLLNTGIAHAQDPIAMAAAMQHACAAGYLGFRAGRIPRKTYATASSPWEGIISSIPGE